MARLWLLPSTPIGQVPVLAKFHHAGGTTCDAAAFTQHGIERQAPRQTLRAAGSVRRPVSRQFPAHLRPLPLFPLSELSCGCVTLAHLLIS